MSRPAVRPVTGVAQPLLEKFFLSDVRTGHAYFDGCFMPDHFLPVSRQVFQFPVDDSDVWVCSFPKTGTTWTQEMVWAVAHNFDYKTAIRTSLHERFPFLEVSGLFKPLGLKYIEEIKARKTKNMFIKTHLPFYLLPYPIQNRSSKAKLIVVSRNPMDTCISYFHHCRAVEGYTGNLEDFVTLFINDAVAYAPYSDNILSYWELRGDPNILFLKYEDMKKDLAGEIRKTADFLGYGYTEEQVSVLAKDLSFENMRRTKSRHPDDEDEEEDERSDGKYRFYRKGKVGSWKEEFTPDQIRRLRKWSEERFKDSGLSWPVSI